MKDIFLFSTSLFVQFRSRGGNRSEHETHLGLAWCRLCVCWMEVPTVDWVLERITTVFFLSSVPHADLHCSPAIRSTQEMGFINTFKCTSGFGDLWSI